MSDIEGEDKKKREILKSIISKREDILARLEIQVQLAHPFFVVEEGTGRVDLSKSENFPLVNPEKIFLAFLGKYFARHYGILEDDVIGMKDLSDDLGIPATTLSKPLGELVENHIVERRGRNRYEINPHKIEVTLRKLRQKYIDSHNPNESRVPSRCETEDCEGKTQMIADTPIARRHRRIHAYSKKFKVLSLTTFIER